MSLLLVRILVGEHHALDAGCGRISPVLEEHGLISGASSDHEVLLRCARLFQILFDGFFCDLFLGISDLAEIRTPGGKAKAHKEVEDDDIGDKPPV